MSAGATPSRLAVLLFTDIVGSTELKSRLGTPAYAKLLERHNELFESGLAEIAGAEVIKHTGDGYFAVFPTASDAVRFALVFQSRMGLEPWKPRPLRTRVGIHIGEVALVDMAGRKDVIGFSADVAARLMSLAVGGQILLTQTAFNDARQFVTVRPPLPAGEGQALPPLPPGEGRGEGTPAFAGTPPLRWIAHGAYSFRGSDDPLDVFEVGIEGFSPLSRPPDSEKAKRVVPHDQEPTLGWRPAVSIEIPGRAGWILEKKLGEGGFGEVWLARHQKLNERRVIKFCFNADRLRSFKREMTLFRLLREALGDRDDIAKIYEVKLDEPPFFLESEYTEGGNLTEWAERQGGLDKVPLDQRLELVAKIADAVAAAHSVGVLHKDIKPSNILIDETPLPGGEGSTSTPSPGTPGEGRVRVPRTRVQPRISDFGIGILHTTAELERLGITQTGFTETTLHNDSSRTGTRMYSPPELLTGKAFTTQGDVYALGVLLYQMIVGDLHRPLAPGWERDLPDEILREDVAKMVEGDPTRRTPSATVVAERIRSLPQRRIERDIQRRAEARLRRRRRQVKLATAALLILAALSTILAISLWRERELRLRARLWEAEALFREAEAIEQSREARWQSYLANITSAATAISNCDVETALTRLGQCPPEFRDWEWGFLSAEADQSLQRFDSPQSIFESWPIGSHDSVTVGDNLGVVGWTIAGPEQYELVVENFLSRQRTPLLRDRERRPFVVNPTGETLIAAQERSLLVIDIRTGRRTEVVHAAEGERLDIRSLAIAYDGRRGAAVLDTQVGRKIVSIDTTVPMIGCEINDEEGITLQHPLLVVSNDGARIALLAWRGVYVYDVEHAKMVRTLCKDREVVSACFLPCSQFLVLSVGSSTEIWDLLTGERLLELPVAVGSLACSQDGRRLAGASNNIHIWDLPSGNLRTAYLGQARSMAFTRDGRQLVASGWRYVQVWDATRSGHRRDKRFNPNLLSLNPHGTRILTTSSDGSGGALIRMYDSTSLMPVPHYPYPLRQHPDHIAFSHDGRRLAIAEQEIAVIDLLTGVQTDLELPATAVKPAYDNRLWCSGIAFLPTTGWLVGTFLSGDVIFWSPDDGRIRRQYQFDSPWGVAAVGDSGLMAIGDAHGLTIIDPLTGKIQKKIASDTGWAMRPVVSRDGELAASAGSPVRLWNLKAGDCRVLGRHGAQCVLFSPNAERLIRDSLLLIWATRTADEVLRLHHAENDRLGFRIAWSPDGSAIVSIQQSGLVLLDSKPYRERVVEQQTIQAAQARANSLVKQLLAELADPAAVYERLRLGAITESRG